MNICELLNRLSQRQGGSDLLITVGKPPQMRVNGSIETMDLPVFTAEDTEGLVLSTLTEAQKKEFFETKELDFSFSADGAGRFRVNIYQQRGSMALVARKVNEAALDITELGLPEVLYKFASLPRGLVLVTGPVGSGKSTTVASMINYINQTRACHIVTVEDPIEFIHDHQMSTIDQREVGSDTNSFQDALRRVLRQSPDVVMIGEIRDPESARAALRLAETGHLTLATLHTRGSIGSVNRIIDMFPSELVGQIRNQLAACLAGVVWQQLLPRKYDNGLVVACEVISAIPAIRMLIRQGRTHEMYSVIQSGKKHDMITMEQSVNELISADIIDADMINENRELYLTTS